MASDNEHDEIGLNVENVPLDLEKEDGELSTYSFESVTSTPLSLALSRITISGAESPFTDVSSLHQMILEEEEEETNALNELEQEKNRLLKQIESELEKKKKETKKTKKQLLKEIEYLKQVKNKIKHSEKKGNVKKKKSRKKIKSKICKRRNSVVGIAQQDHIAQQDDDIPNTLNDKNSEDDRMFPSLHEVRAIKPTEINNGLKLTMKGSAEPERLSRIDQHIGTSHYPHSKSKRKKSSDSRNKSQKFYDEIESCSNERSESGSYECLQREKSPMKSHHARHRIGHPTNTRHKHKTKSKSPNRRRQSRDEDRSNKSPKFYDEIESRSNERSESGSDECLEREKSPMKSHHDRHRIGHPTDTRHKHKTKSKSPNRRRQSRDEDRPNKEHTKSKSPNQKRHSRDKDGSNKKHHYEEHQVVKSRSSDRKTTPPKGYRLRDETRASRSPTRKEKHRDQSPYTGSSRFPHYHSRSPHVRTKSSHSDPDSGYPGKRHPRHRSSSSSTSLSSSSGSSANSEHSVKFIDFLVQSVIRNKEVVELSSRTSSLRGNSPASDKTLPLPLHTTSTFFNSIDHHSSTPSLTPASPEIHIIGEVVPTNASIAIDINKNEQSIVKEPSEPIIPPSSPEQIVPGAPLPHHSEDNLSNYNVMSMETESLYDPFETSSELSDDVAKITVVEGTRGRREMIEANMVRYKSGVDKTTRNNANLITVTSVKNNAIETPLRQSGCNSNSQTVIEQITTGQKETENNIDLNNDQLKKRQSIDSENPLNEQDKSDTENSQFIIVKKISRSETALDTTRSVKVNHGNETDFENAQLVTGKHTSETDKRSRKNYQTIVNKTSFKDAQSTEKYLETIETTHTMKVFLDNATVGASTEFVTDKLDGETIINQESHTTNSVTCDNHQDLDIDLGLEDESLGLLPNMKHREILIYQLDKDYLLQNTEIPDFVANGVAEFFAELQRVLCIAPFNKNYENDDVLRIEKWFIIINSVYQDLVHLKNQFTFVKMVKYYHVLEVILHHFRDCVNKRHSIKMYAEHLPIYIKQIEVIRTCLNSHKDKEKIFKSSSDHDGAKFFRKKNTNIKKFLLRRVKRLQHRKPQPHKPYLDVFEVTNNIEENNSFPVPQPSKPYLDVFEVTNNIEENNWCPVPQPSKPYLDVFEVTNKIDHMLTLIDGPKCYEMFEKISLKTLEHLLNKIKRELQDSEAEEYVNKCKELINEKIRITTLKEYIEKMYKNYVVQNNLPLPDQIDNLIAINNDLKSWKSTLSLKQKIKEILLKHEESFVTKKVEANAIDDVFEIAKPIESNAIDDVVEIAKPVESNAMDDVVEIAKPVESNAIEDFVKIARLFESNAIDDVVEIAKPVESNAIEDVVEIAKPVESNATDDVFEIAKPVESNAMNDVVEIAKPVESNAMNDVVEIAKPVESNAIEAHKKSESIEIVKPAVFQATETHTKDGSVEISKPIVSNATETFQNNEFVQIAKPTLLVTIDTHKKNYSVEIVKPNGKPCKKDNANETAEPIVPNVVESHKKRDSVDGVKSMVSPSNDITNSVSDSELPNKNPNKSTLVNLDKSGTIPMDLNDSGSIVSLGNEFSDVKDSRLQRQSINVEPDSLNPNVYAHVDESIVYKLIPLDVFIPFVRARNHLASYSKREEEAKDKGKPFKPDLRLEKDKLRLKQEIQGKLALSETMKEGLSRTGDKIPKDVVKIVDSSVKVVKAGVGKTSSSATKKCNTVDLDMQVKCKDPRLGKRDVGLENNSKPKNHQDKSNKKDILLEDQSLSLLPLQCSQIIEASCAIVQLNKENRIKEAEGNKDILENKLTINTGLDSKHSKLHSILKTTKRDVLQSDNNNIPSEHNKSRNFLQQKIYEIDTSLKPKTPTEQLKPAEGNSWSRIPFQCSQNNENLHRKIQSYKIPKISRAKETPSEKNMSEPWILKAKETNSENSMKSSEPMTEKDNNLKIECDAKALKANKEIDSTTDTLNSQQKIETSHTLQVDRKITDIDNPSNIQKNTENALSAVKVLTSVKDKPTHTNLKKKSNKQISETKNLILQEKISKLERDMLESKNNSEKIDVKNITGNDKLGSNFKVFDLFGDTPKSLKNKKTVTENKDGKIKNSLNNGTEEGKGKSKEKNEGIVIEKPLNKSKDNQEISHKTKTLQFDNESDVKIKNSWNNGTEEVKDKSKEKNDGIVIEKPLNKSIYNQEISHKTKTLQSGNESDGKIKNSWNDGTEEGKGKSKEENEGIVIEKPLNKSKDNQEISHKTKTLQSGNESVQRDTNAWKSPSSNYQFSKNYKRMEHLFMKTPYLKPFRRDSKLFDCCVLLDQNGHKSGKGLLKRKINSANIDQNVRKKKRIDGDGKDLSNAIIILKQTNVPKLNETTYEQSNKMKIKRKSTHEVEQSDIIKKGNNIKKQKESNDSSCVNKESSLVDTHFRINELDTIFNKDELKQPEKPTEKKIENCFYDESTINIEKRSNTKNKEISQLSSKKVDNSKIMEKVESCSLDHDFIKGPASEKAKKSYNKSNKNNGKRPSEYSGKIKETSSKQGQKSSPTTVEMEKEKNCSNEHNDFSSQRSNEYVEECNKSDKVNLSGRGKENESNEQVILKPTNHDESGSYKQVTVTNRCDKIKSPESSKQVNFTSDKSESNEQSVAIAASNKFDGARSESIERAVGTSYTHNAVTSSENRERENVCSIEDHEIRSEGNKQVMEISNESGEIRSRSSKQAIVISDKDDARGSENSEQCNKQDERSPEHGGASEPLFIENNKTRTLQEVECCEKPIEVNLSEKNEKENLTTDANEEVQFIESISIVTKKREMLRKKINVKEAWERMREHVAKSKLSMLSTTAIATIHLEQPSRIEKDSNKMIVENNAPKAIFLKRYSLDSNLDRNERKLPIKLNLRRCSEDTWEKVKEKEFDRKCVKAKKKEFDRVGVLNMLEQRKQSIEKAILLLQGHLGTDADGVEDSERSNVSNMKNDCTNKDILNEPVENQIHSTDTPMHRNKKSMKTSKGKFHIENFIKENVEK